MTAHLDASVHAVSLYALFAFAGIVAFLAVAYGRYRAIRPDFSFDRLFFAVLMILPGALFGAKAFQIIGNVVVDGANPGFWTWEHWLEMIPGVGVMYGGFVGGMLAACLGCKMFSIPFQDYTDLITPCVPAFMIFGRIGCFTAGCCYGIPSDSGLAHFAAVLNPDLGARIPVQLFEAGVNLLLMLVFLRLRSRKTRRGMLFVLYAISYAASRFVLEFFRGDEHRGVYILSTSQWLSLAVILVCIVLFVRRRSDAPKRQEKRTVLALSQ